MEVTEHLFAYIREREYKKRFTKVLFFVTIGAIAGWLFSIGMILSMHHK